ncbi:hypothetical protein AK88_00063 [Plasmodium fragile]|uniref:Transporter n=1 Tax=Plasmodium fragile TaxID=5857 RepID=A0A0D9QT26_PLAFR|nr:uncharacterized protein AK88_00063 [Plasmodium fragile]KJP90215.1 hypothetical protein AK88_00063 [Plasmodium fragile]
MENKANKENVTSEPNNTLGQKSQGKNCQTVGNFAFSSGAKKKSCVIKGKEVQQKITPKLRSLLQAEKKKKKNCAKQVQAEPLLCQELQTGEKCSHDQKGNKILAFNKKEKKVNKHSEETNTICSEKGASKIGDEQGANSVSDGQKSYKNASLINFLKKIKREKFQSTAQILNETYLYKRKKKRDHQGCKKKGANYWEQVGTKSSDIGGNKNQSPGVKIQRVNMQNNESPLEGSHPGIGKNQNPNGRHKSCQKGSSPSNVLQMEGGNSNTFYDAQSDKYYVKFDSKQCKNDVDIDHDLLSTRSNHIGGGMVKEELQPNHASTISKMKKFFLIFFNGCLVVFLGVSNNICGRMRNRVLNNFDSLTASYNAIAYVAIYLVLCIIYIKSKSITKEHWSYIYPCLSSYFKKRDKKGADVGKINRKKEQPKEQSDCTIDVRDQEAIRRKKKIMKLFYIHKKRIYEPLLEKGREDVEVGNGGATNNSISSSISGSLNSSRCSSRCAGREGNPMNTPTLRQSDGRSNSQGGANAHTKLIHEKNAQAGEDKHVDMRSAQNTGELLSHENKEPNNGKTHTRCPCSHAIVQNSAVEGVYSFSKQDMKDILEHYHHDKPYDVLRSRETTDKGVLASVKKKWKNLGAYKYVVVIALFDIISNTLYFVSQLAIPLTILLLLNQLNFIFSIILSYIILKRKYNIHHALSVIIVIVGFLFFYIPYVYKEDTVVSKQTMVSFYMNSHFYLNVNNALQDSASYFNSVYPCNDPTCSTASQFGMFASIIFCVLSILLTSYGGILREIFFSEYIKGREKRNRMVSIRKIKRKFPRFCSAMCTPELGVPQNDFSEMDTEERTSSEESNTQGIKHGHRNKATLFDYPLFNKPTDGDRNGYMINVQQLPVSHQERANEMLSGVSASKENGIMDGVASTERHFTSACPMCRKGDGVEAGTSKGVLDSMEGKPIENPVEIEQVTPKRDTVQKTQKRRSASDKMSVILLSFNISLIQICLLPMIIYFQLLFNKNKDVSYFLYIKDSMQCFSGYTTENNSNCKYSLGVYILYIVVNAIFNLSVSSFYSNYSSAECFLILKSSTPLTLVVLYFYDFPFILESDKYFSIYFVISIMIVFTGVSYFFYQSIASDKKTKKRKVAS